MCMSMESREFFVYNSILFFFGESYMIEINVELYTKYKG